MKHDIKNKKFDMDLVMLSEGVYISWIQNVSGFVTTLQKMYGNTLKSSDISDEYLFIDEKGMASIQVDVKGEVAIKMNLNQDDYAIRFSIN